MIQLREVSATRNSRMYKVEDKLMQKRGKYHSSHQLRGMTIMSAMPKQRRDWMPRSHGRVESESKQMWSKYYATHQQRETSTISTQKRVCQPEC